MIHSYFDLHLQWGEKKEKRQTQLAPMLCSGSHLQLSAMPAEHVSDRHRTEFSPAFGFPHLSGTASVSRPLRKIQLNFIRFLLLNKGHRFQITLFENLLSLHPIEEASAFLPSS